MEGALDKIMNTLAGLREDLEESRKETSCLHKAVGELQASMQDLRTSKEEDKTHSPKRMPRLLREEEGDTKATEEINLKISPPERFHGNPKHFQAFITQCNLNYRARVQQFKSEQAKVLFLISNLGGDALAWASPLVDQNSYLLDDYETFMREFKRVFECKQAVQARKMELISLRQGSSDLSSYIAKFNQLVLEVGWPVEAQYPIFLMGLRDEIKEMLQFVFPQPETIRDLMELVVQIDQHRLEKKGDYKRMEFRRPRPQEKTSDSDQGGKNPATNYRRIESRESRPRGPLMTEERDRRRKLGLCLYCGQSGHLLKECPLTKRAPAPSTSVKLATQENLEPCKATPSSQDQGNGNARV